MSVVAKNIPLTVSEQAVREFFQICGKIDSLSLLPDTQSKSQIAAVTFTSPSAVSSATLLNGAELGGQPIEISVSSNTQPTGGETPSEVDITEVRQEDKPKSTILAEYLANGYILSDQILQRGIEFDKKHGWSARFKSFISQLDSKYHVNEKSEEIDKKYGISDNISNTSHSLMQYVEKALDSPRGVQVKKFYRDLVNNATEVHEEAKKIAEAKRGASQTEAQPVDPSGSKP